MTQANEARWVLKTMAAMAAADQRLDAREVGLIRKVYQEQTGQHVDVSGVVSAVQMYANERDVVAELAEVAGALTRDIKEPIIHGAYQTLAANGRISEGERTKLEAIAAALRVSETHLKDVLTRTDET